MKCGFPPLGRSRLGMRNRDIGNRCAKLKERIINRYSGNARIAILGGRLLRGGKKEENKMDKIRLLSLFSGIGAFEKALINLKVPYEIVNYCEIDKMASKAYSALYGIPETKNLWDVTKIDGKQFKGKIDLITYGFPCQDISSAGLQKGFFDENGNQTRSGLFFNALKIIKESQPKVAIAENVEALTFIKFKTIFAQVIEGLDSVGYNTYWKILDARNFGIPQSRRRVFIVSFRKDIDPKYGDFIFPSPYPLKRKLIDFLENGEVNQKLFFSQSQIDRMVYLKSRTFGKGIPIKSNTKKGFIEGYDNYGVDTAIISRSGRRGTVKENCIPTITSSKCTAGIIQRIYGLSNYNLLNPIKTGGAFPTIMAGYYKSKVNPIAIPFGFPIQKRRCETPILTNGIIGTLTAQHSKTNYPLMVKEDNKKIGQYNGYAIRMLTARECLRLMGFDDKDYEKLSKIEADKFIYHQAGNSIVVNVVQELLKSIIDKMGGTI